MNFWKRHCHRALRPALLCGMLACLATIVLPHSGIAEAEASEVRTYKIPAQNLAAALDVYATISGLQVLYESSLVSGRLSSPVDGMLTSGAALQNLLAGTGLSGRMTDVDAVTISVKPEEHAHVPSGPELQL